MSILKIRDKKGFLLLEVLVSITIITLGLVYIIRSFSSSSRAVDTATKFLKSVALAEEKMWDLEAAGFIAKGTDEGKFAGEQFAWKTETEAVKDASINQVKLKVEWKGRRGTQRVSLDTYLWNEEE